MKNKFWIVVIFAFIVLGIGGFLLFNFINKGNEPVQNYEAKRTEVNTTNNISLNKTETKEPEKKETSPKETEISSFSTPIVSQDAARQNNVSITCSSLNDTVVENGATFSFCDTVGQATTEKGYQKAEIFDKNGNKILGLGGGNCQVSSTLYNAVLAVDSLQVTERHAHSNKVPYIESGKDAAVAYGSYDLKFVNNSGHPIKIGASSENGEVCISIFKIE